VEGVLDQKEPGSMSTLDVFDIFSRDYARERFETMSLRDWLLAARDDKMFYATPAEFERVVGAMDTAAAALGARELYFTIRTGGEARKASVEKLGFKHVDDDVIVKRDPDGLTPS
jgi:hypothetical protein